MENDVNVAETTTIKSVSLFDVLNSQIAQAKTDAESKGNEFNPIISNSIGLPLGVYQVKILKMNDIEWFTSGENSQKPGTLYCKFTCDCEDVNSGAVVTMTLNRPSTIQYLNLVLGGLCYINVKNNEKDYKEGEFITEKQAQILTKQTALSE